MFSKIKKVLFMPRSKSFSDKLLRLALPMMLEQFLMSSLFIFDSVFVGALGDEYLGAVGQAGNMQMLLWCGFIALSGAGAVFAAQHWGKDRNEAGIRKSYTVSLMFTMLLAVVFFAAVFCFRDGVMGVLSRDAAVRRIGAEYLSIICFAYPLWACIAVLAAILRAMGITRLPMIASAVAAALNILADSVFVTGNLGFPKLGVPAAAVSTVAGAALELALLLVFARRSGGAISARRSDFVWPGRALIIRYVKTALPLAAKDQLWAAGTTVYSISFAALGVASTAAYNVYGTLSQFMNVLFMGFGNAGGILIGHELGAGELERAKNYAWRLLRVVFVSSVAIAPVFVLLRDVLLLPYPNLTDEAVSKAREALVLGALIIWARGVNFTNMDGILRAGGDTFGAAAIDVGVLWGVGVPLTVLAGMLLRLPFATVLLMTCLEEIVKAAISVARVRSYRWVRRLV